MLVRILCRHRQITACNKPLNTNELASTWTVAFIFFEYKRLLCSSPLPYALQTNKKCTGQKQCHISFFFFLRMIALDNSIECISLKCPWAEQSFNVGCKGHILSVASVRSPSSANSWGSTKGHTNHSLSQLKSKEAAVLS